MAKWINREYVPMLVNGSSEKKIKAVMESVLGYAKSVALEIEEIGFAVCFNAELEKHLVLSFKHNGVRVEIREEYLNNVVASFVSWTLNVVKNEK